jgi:hypothetical protein
VGVGNRSRTAKCRGWWGIGLGLAKNRQWECGDHQGVDTGRDRMEIKMDGVVDS